MIIAISSSDVNPKSERNIPVIIIMRTLIGKTIVCVKYQWRIEHGDWRIVVGDASVEQATRRHLKDLKQFAVPVHVRCNHEEVQHCVWIVTTPLNLLLRGFLPLCHARCSWRNENVGVGGEKLDRFMLNLLRWNGVEIDVNLSLYRFGTQQIHEMGVQVVYRIACEPKSHTFRKLINGFFRRSVCP